jgi:hypothetical protein
LILKSGTDFRQLSLNKLVLYKYDQPFTNSPNFTMNQDKHNYFTKILKGSQRMDIFTQKLEITSDLAEDELINKFATNLQDLTNEKFKQIICCFNSPIEAHFSQVRTKSLPISNFIADLVNFYMATDCTLINSGTLRIDSTINEGDFE